MNAQEHRIAGVATFAALSATLALTDEDRLMHAATDWVGGYCPGTLPDLIEPTTHPLSAVLHGWLFGDVLVYGVYRLYRWAPQTAEQKLLGAIRLIVGGTYLVHLAVDATTKRSLPVVGQFF